MELDLKPKHYVEWKVYNVTTMDGKYGFRIHLTFADGSKTTQESGGYATKKIANENREKVIASLHNGTYVVYRKIKVIAYFEYWLEEIMRPEITSDSYDSYANIVYNYIKPLIGNLYMTTLNRGHIQKFYNKIAEKSHDVSRIAKAVMNTGLNFAIRKKVISVNVSKGVNLPKCVQKKEYHTIKINTRETLNLKQIFILIQEAKGSKIYLQVLFAVLMGLRRCEINGIKYSDIDYIHRKLNLERQLGKVPNSKKEDFNPKEFTKQEIGLKTPSSYRELDIPDFVFEAILEERKMYEQRKNRRKNDKSNPFQDLDYICCSTYGRPRSKNFHWEHFKALLEKANLPDIKWHGLRKTYSTLLMKNEFNLKAISNLLGHSKEIISADVYIDNTQMVEDCLEELEPFIESIIPKDNVKKKSKDIESDSDNNIETDIITEEYFKEIMLV